MGRVGALYCTRQYCTAPYLPISRSLAHGKCARICEWWAHSRRMAGWGAGRGHTNNGLQKLNTSR